MWSKLYSSFKFFSLTFSSSAFLTLSQESGFGRIAIKRGENGGGSTHPPKSVEVSGMGGSRVREGVCVAINPCGGEKIREK